MAPTKFGLFKSRSREQPEQPSTENLLESNNEPEIMKPPDSPIPSTSRGITGYNEILSPDIFAILQMDDDDDDEIIAEDNPPSRPASQCSKAEEEQLQTTYQLFDNQSGTSMSTLEDIDQISQISEDPDTIVLEDDVSSAYDANSLQYDQSSVAESEDKSSYCALLKKPKKSKSKEQQQLKDEDMWQASNSEVMKNLLNRTGTRADQLKWEAIATARGLCTLTDTCSCADCTKALYLAGITDGDAGLGTAPLIAAFNVGCQVQ